MWVAKRAGEKQQRVCNEGKARTDSADREHDKVQFASALATEERESSERASGTVVKGRSQMA